MGRLTFTLWAEGTSDACLIPILIWLLQQCGLAEDTIEQNEALIFRNKKKYPSLADLFTDDYWSDLLFVHMDADSDEETGGKGPQERGRQCAEKVNASGKVPPHICVIPVQETETWLLASESALRRVTGNTKKVISLPGRSRLEGVGNPKRRLCGVLRELGAEIKEDEANTRIWRLLAESIPATEPTGYGILRGIPSFDRLEATVKMVLERQGLTQH